MTYRMTYFGIFDFGSKTGLDLQSQITWVKRVKLENDFFRDYGSCDTSLEREFDADSESVKIFHFWSLGGAGEPNW